MISIPIPKWLFELFVGKKRIEELENRAEFNGKANFSRQSSVLPFVDVEVSVSVEKALKDRDLP
jgi:hypothetical protein